MRWILSLSLLFGGIFAAGCSSEEHPDEVPMSTAGVAIDEKYPQHDPVCGLRVNPRSAIKEDHGGKTWYFDSYECWEKFHDNPTAYLPMGDKEFAYMDPVCKMKLDPRTAFYREEYDGKMFYFDSKQCWDKFKENPHAYQPGGDDRPTEREVR